MSYIGLSKNSKVVLINEITESGELFSMGEILFSFLEMDFSKYNKVYKTINKSDFSYEDFYYLESQYPQTYEDIIRHYTLPSVNNAPAELQQLALPFLLENQDDFHYLYDHPVFECTNIAHGACDFRREHNDLNFFYLQQYCESLLDFCFISDDCRLKNLSKQERYFIFSAATPYMDSLFYSKNTFFTSPCDLRDSIRMTLFDEHQKTHEIYDWINGNPLDILSLLTDATIDKVHNSNIKLLDVSYCETPFDLLAFELREFFLKNIEVKRCANCGKFFIPSGNYNTDCCDRVPNGEKYSCKKIMARKRRREKEHSDPIIKEYNRAYKRNYARVSNHKMDPNDFRLWVDTASKKRDDLSLQYQQSESEQIIIDFKKYLGNK